MYYFRIKDIEYSTIESGLTYEFKVNTNIDATIICYQYHGAYNTGTKIGITIEVLCKHYQYNTTAQIIV